MYTKGKWTISSSVLVVSESAQIIANCMPLGVPELEIPLEESEANAKLIAAAPALLEACKRYIAYRKGADDIGGAVAKEIETAIEQATK